MPVDWDAPEMVARDLERLAGSLVETASQSELWNGNATQALPSGVTQRLITSLVDAVARELGDARKTWRADVEGLFESHLIDAWDAIGRTMLPTTWLGVPVPGAGGAGSEEAQFREQWRLRMTDRPDVLEYSVQGHCSAPEGAYIRKFSLPRDKDRVYVKLDIEPQEGASVIRIPIFIFSRASWQDAWLRQPGTQAATLQPLIREGGRPIGVPLTSAPLGFAASANTPLRLAWWTEWTDDHTSGEPFIYRDAKNKIEKNVVVNVLALEWLTSSSLGNRALEIDIPLPPGIGAFDASTEIVRCELNRVMAEYWSAYASSSREEMANPQKWVLDPQDPIRKQAAPGAVLIPQTPRSAAEEAKHMYVRSRLRAVAQHRGLANRVDISDAVNRCLSLHARDESGARRLLADPESIVGGVDFDGASREVRILWEVPVTARAEVFTRPGLHQEMLNVLQRTENILAPRVPPGTKLRLKLIGAPP